MNKSSIYYQQVTLLIRMLPLVAQEKVFALKGGTAINLFVRNFPRLSVDIDSKCEGSAWSFDCADQSTTEP